MKVLLINPPRLNEIIGNNPSIIEEERGFNPPLGILYIASYIETYSDYDISVIDCQVEGLTYRDLESRISSIDPDVVGITAMTMTMVDVLETATIIKKTNQDIKVVLGGPHATLFPNETINLPGIDFLVLGEGEATFKDLLDHIGEPEKLKEVKGLVFTENRQVLNTGLRPFVENLDDIPFPARHLVPYDKYSSLLTFGKVVTTIFTSRGCPFKCTFCDRPHLGKHFRARSAKNVVDEIEECIHMGIEDFLFYDDTFTVNKKRVIDICNEIVSRGLKIGWDIRARVDTIDESVLRHLKKAHCQGIHYGVEAGTDKILKVLNKGIKIEKAQKVFKMTRKYKIPILAYFMIGNPTEDIQDIKETFRIMKKLNPDYVHMTILSPFPGTKIYHDGLENGIIEKDYWKEFALNPTKDFVPPHWGENFTREELNGILVKGYHAFYMRPSYILKKLIRTKSLAEFTQLAKGGLKVLFMGSRKRLAERSI